MLLAEPIGDLVQTSRHRAGPSPHVEFRLRRVDRIPTATGGDLDRFSPPTRIGIVSPLRQLRFMLLPERERASVVGDQSRLPPLFVTLTLLMNDVQA